MYFEQGYLYHIYNQGNNRQKIFFNRENYLFFLRKIKKYITPYAEVIAWVLMPNHFHLMVLVNNIEVEVYQDNPGVSHRHTGIVPPPKKRTFNESIGIMLMAYSKALNKQRYRSGKLFREETKSECINCPDGIAPTFFGNIINVSIPEREYPQVCFNYIHKNPVKAGLVENVTDWEFSSAKDYAGLRGGKLVNKQLAAKYVNIISKNLNGIP
jgi:putative transposase